MNMQALAWHAELTKHMTRALSSSNLNC